MAMWNSRLKWLAFGIMVLCLLAIVVTPPAPVNLHIKNVKDPMSRLAFTGNTDHSADQGDQELILKEQYPYSYQFSGFCFNEKGRTLQVKAEITTSIIHNFSPYIEHETAKRFVDMAHNQVFYANSPAVKWFKGRLFMVSRIWLERERYEAKQNWPANHFADNWLYSQQFDRHMKPVTNGTILGIPLPKQWWVGDGPIEPRVCIVKNRLFITFNAAMAYAVTRYIDYTVLWDYEQGIPIIPKIYGGTPMINATAKNDMPRDKHWMALIQNDELYFVHNLDPLRVLHCTLQGYCRFVHNEKDRQKGLIFDDHISHLRGGTPFELYEWPYYISVAHSTMYKKSNHHRYYTAHLVVLCVQPYRIVYVSNDLKINPKIYEKIPIVRWRYIDDGFIFPVGLIIEDRDRITIGVHVSDHSSVLIRAKGIEAVMRQVIKHDTAMKPKHGPPIRYLHSHVHDAIENDTRIKFS